MDKHVTILGALYMAFSAMGLLGAFITFMAVAGGGMLSGDMEAMLVTTTVGSVIAFFLLFVSIPGLIGGYGLLKKYGWARIVVLILGFINLINIPFGTILGVYTLWVLLKDETVQLFAAGS